MQEPKNQMLGAMVSPLIQLSVKYYMFHKLNYDNENLNFETFWKKMENIFFTWHPRGEWWYK